jgi:hypothetical protein
VAEGVRESGEGQMRGGEASRDGVPAYNCRRELGLGWTASDAIGQRGQCLGAALWAISREHAGCVGGCRFHAESRRVQWLSRENVVRLGRRGAPRGWARVAVRRACDAVRACVRCRGRRNHSTRERRARSGRSVDVSLARSGGTHGRLWAGLTWGMDPWGRCEADGEATAREVVGDALTKHAAHHRQWQRPGRRRGGAGGSLLRGVG